MQDEGLHLLPPKLKGVGAPEDMPELEIWLQPLEETGGDHRWPMSSSFGHLQEETAMPTLPLPDPAIGFNGDPAKQVFDACIEGVQERSES